MHSTPSLFAFVIGYVVYWTAGLMPLERTPDRRQPNIDVIHYTFDLTVPDSGSVIDGHATIVFRRLNNEKQLQLDLVALKVDSVALNGVSCDFVQDPQHVTISLASISTHIADTLSVSITYGGAVKDGLIIRKDTRGRWTAFGDNWPTRARFWLPCVDEPNDKASVEWKVTAPSDRQVIANGLLVRNETLTLRSGIQRTLTIWNEENPIPTYCMVVAVAPLKKYDLPAQPGPHQMVQSVYVQPELIDFLPGPFKYAEDMVDYFSRIIAPFPYEKLAHVQSSTRYGGMENASAIFYSDEGFQQRSMGPGVIAHETAHQWFGDAVTEREWSHVWLSEGFATYFEELWTQHFFGDSAFRSKLAESRRQIVQDRVVELRPVIDTLQTDPMALLNTNSYQKGSWVLHMLRSLLGDSAFFSGIRSFYGKHRNSTADSDELEEAFEQTSYKDLRWFFDEWLRRPGFVDLEIAWQYNDERRTIALTIRQTKGPPYYRCPLTIEILCEDGRRVREILALREKEETKITLENGLRSKPKDIVIDPGVELLATFRVLDERNR